MSSGRAGPIRLLFGGGVMLVVCVVPRPLVNRVARRRTARRRAAAADKPLGKEGGFADFADRYLMLIAVLTVLLNIVNTTGEYLFGRYVVEQAQAIHGAGPATAAARERFIGETYSQLFSTVNLVGFLLQMFVVSRLFKFLGVGRSLFVHPIVAIDGIPADAAGAVARGSWAC